MYANVFARTWRRIFAIPFEKLQKKGLAMDQWIYFIVHISIEYPHEHILFLISFGLFGLICPKISDLEYFKNLSIFYNLTCLITSCSLNMFSLIELKPFFVANTWYLPKKKSLNNTISKHHSFLDNILIENDFLSCCCIKVNAKLSLKLVRCICHSETKFLS